MLRVYGKPGKTSVKLWVENSPYSPPELFDVSNDESIYIQDVYFPIPETWVNTAEPKRYRLFKGLKKGTTEQSAAPCVAIVNTVKNVKPSFGFGTVNFSGIEKPITLTSKAGHGFIYAENLYCKGLSILDFNANWSGGGVYFGTEGCTFETGSQAQYAVNVAKFNFSFSSDAETLTIKGKDTDSLYWPTREAYTSRSAVWQVKGNGDDRFVFILPNKLQIQTYLQQINGRKADPTISHETKTDKMLCGHIPLVGDTITLQREYETDLYYDDMNGYVLPDPAKADFSCGRWGPVVRSHIAYTTIEQKYGNQLTGKRQNGKYLQAGDVLKDKATGTQHLIKEVRCGYYDVGFGSHQSGYCMEYKPFGSRQECRDAGFVNEPDVFVYQNYVLDPPLPSDAPMLVEFEVVKSRSAYLLDGEYEGEMGWMSNAKWKQSQDAYLTPSTSAVAHSFYCHRELNHDHRNGDASDTDYRENNMNYSHVGGQDFILENGEVVRSLAAHPYFGSQHVNFKVFGGNQYGGGYDKFMPQRAAIIEQEGIEEDYACMQRNIGEVDQGQKVDDAYYTTEEIRPRPNRLLKFLKENRR